MQNKSHNECQDATGKCCGVLKIYLSNVLNQGYAGKENNDKFHSSHLKKRFIQTHLQRNYKGAPQIALYNGFFLLTVIRIIIVCKILNFSCNGNNHRNQAANVPGHRLTLWEKKEKILCGSIRKESKISCSELPWEDDFSPQRLHSSLEILSSFSYF